MNDQIIQILSIALAAVASFLVGAGLERWRKNNNQKQMLNVLYGELQNISRHYGYVANVSFENSFASSEKIKMIMAKYGESETLKNNLEEISFLSPNQIASLLQLTLFIRNNDIIIDTIISFRENMQSKDTENFDIDLKRINMRASQTRDWTAEILRSIENKQKYLHATKSFIG